jgi:hypothetical protein
MVSLGGDGGGGHVKTEIIGCCATKPWGDARYQKKCDLRGGGRVLEVLEAG